MLKLLFIDEKNCFGLIENLGKNTKDKLVETNYFLAPNPSFFDGMVAAASISDIIVSHRKIWIDECDEEDTCTRLNELEQLIKPRTVLKVGSSESNHDTCPQELLEVYKQLIDGIGRLGDLIGAKVKPSNLDTQTLPYLTISKLEIIGSNIVGCVLKTPGGDTRKYFKLMDLRLQENI